MLEDTKKYPAVQGLSLSCPASEQKDTISDVMILCQPTFLYWVSKMNLQIVSQEPSLYRKEKMGHG